jgi:hypothetical protein
MSRGLPQIASSFMQIPPFYLSEILPRLGKNAGAAVLILICILIQISMMGHVGTYVPTDLNLLIG